MLATLPKLADRRFIMGFFLPSLLLAVTLRWLWTGDTKWAELFAKEPTAAVLWIVGIWLFGVLLLAFNGPLYRAYAGQIGPLSWMKVRKARNEAHATEVTTQLAQMFAVMKAGGNLPDEEFKKYGELRRESFESLVTPSGETRPTHFGNVMRAAIDYPRLVYGADAPTVWPRLAAVIPKSFVEQLDDARSKIDFFLNLSFASLVACAAAILAFFSQLKVRAFYDQSGPTVVIDDFVWLPAFVAAAAGLGAWLAYRWSINPLKEWCELVRSAFDLYLPALAKTLGFEVPPTRTARMQFWREFSQTAIYGLDPAQNVDFDPGVWKQIKPAGK